MTPLDLLHGIALGLIAVMAPAAIIVAKPWIGWPTDAEARAFAVGAVQGIVIAVLSVGGVP